MWKSLVWIKVYPNLNATFWGRICLRSPDPVLNPTWIFDIELSPGPNVDLKMRLNAEFKL